MVKIRLRRLGQRNRPFYRIVVAEANTGRNGKFVEILGIYDPISQPKRMEVKEDRALHWLRHGAQPTETAAYILNKLGVLPQYLEERPQHKADYKFLDRRTAPTTADADLAASAAAETENEQPLDGEPAEETTESISETNEVEGAA
jgi:small subunit ribosomal protein S16